MRGIRFFQTVQSKLIVIYVLLILLAMQVIGVYFVRTMENSFKNNFTDSLNKQAYLLAEFVEPYLSANQEGKFVDGKRTYEDLSDVVSKLFPISSAEIQVIDANAVVRVVSSSLQNRQTILNQKNTQKEVTMALQGIRDVEREIDENGEPKKVIAQPIGAGTKVIGAVYIVASMEELYGTMKRINKIFISGTLIALVLTAFLGVILSHTITNPIKEITRQATAMAEGDFNQQVDIMGSDEIGQLGQAFNYMTNRLKEALSLNEEEREKLASILSNMTDGVIATNDRGKVIVVNRRAEEMLQIKEGQAFEKEVFQLLGIPKEKIGAYRLEEGHMTIINLPAPGDEEPLSVRVVFSPIHTSDRGVAGTIAVLQDVTEQEKLEQERKEFVANVSHELRTPLTTLRSYLEALEDGAMADQSLAPRFLHVARNETERMIRLVNDLLHLSKLDSKRAIPMKEPTNITEMLEEVADRFSFQLRQKNIRLRIDKKDKLGKVLLDRDQIDQVLDNLISNSLKYTPEGGHIRIVAQKVGDNWVEISVEDNGIGIPKKDINRIFDRFYRVDKARSRSMGGTGLGLSIAREIIKAHGGIITLESELNRGTKVTFTLPVRGEGVEAV